MVHMNRLVTLYSLLPLGSLKMQFAVRISVMSLLNTEFAFKISVIYTAHAASHCCTSARGSRYFRFRVLYGVP